MAKTRQTYAAKDRVEHSVFGLGTIIEIDAHHATIAFDENGTRKFAMGIVKLTHSETPAPAKRVRKSKSKSVKR